MIKLIDLLEASKTSTTQGSEEMGGYSGFVKPEEFESYKKWIAKTLKVQLVEGALNQESLEKLAAFHVLTGVQPRKDKALSKH